MGEDRDRVGPDIAMTPAVLQSITGNAMARISSACPFPSEAFCYRSTDAIPEAFDDSWFAQYGIDLPARVALSVPTRRREFFWGRLCAHVAIRRFAPNLNGQITIGSHGCPVFPDGFEGSISHGGDHAVAVCQPAELGRLGVDVEPLITQKTTRDIGPLIASQAEIDRADWGDAHESLRLTLIFSAKEALFKAMYPDIARIVDFSCASVAGVDRTVERLLLTIEEDLSGRWNRGRQIEAQFKVYADRVITLVCAAH